MKEIGSDETDEINQKVDFTWQLVIKDFSRKYAPQIHHTCNRNRQNVVEKKSSHSISLSVTLVHLTNTLINLNET